MVVSTGVGTTTPDVWQNHKKKVQDLYVEKDLNLKEVMGIMEQQHGFKAS